MHLLELAVVLGAAVLTQVVTAVLPLVVRSAVDDAILSGRRPLRPLLAVMLGLAAARFGIAFVRRYYAMRVGIGIEYDLRNAVYDHLQRLDFARHDEMRTGQLVSRANTDVRVLEGIIGTYLPLVSANILFLVVAIVLMLRLSPPLTLVAVLTVPVMVVMAERMRKIVHPASWDAMAKSAEVATIVEETVTGVRVVKGFGQERRELGRLVDAATGLFGSRMRNTRISASRQAALEMVPSLGQLGVLAYGGWLAVHGRITIGTFLAFSTYMLMLVAPAAAMAGIVIMAQMARAATERIFEILDSTAVVTERPGAAELGALRGEVVFDGVGFGYTRSDPVLRDFTLRVHPGETVALVGASGSGKSTAGMLLPRFYDVHSGSVRLDGVDVRDVTLDSLRRQIGVVFEESFLFSESIRANIAYGRPDATDADVHRAARAAEADGFIQVLPDGYDTVVGERGLTLSGGQRQRVALARAILTEPRLLILDDATSAVDSLVEEEIHRTLRRLMDGRTTLLVAHRRSTLALADRIAVVQDGRVLDHGTHDELTARCRAYRLLLSGPGMDAEGVGATEVDDDLVSRDGGTGSAWSRPEGAMLAKGGGLRLGDWLSGSEAEELQAAIDGLPAIVDRPDLDLEREARHDPEFRLLTFLRPYLKPLVVGLALVAVNALAAIAGPSIIRLGIDRGVARSSLPALWAFSAVFLAVVVFNRVLTWVVGVYTGRTGQRLLMALRVRIFAHLQRLGLDYYEHEMAGRIMTRMTSDVEALNTLLQSGVIRAFVHIVTFAGTLTILFTMNAVLAGWVVAVLPPFVAATWWFRRRSDRVYLTARERLAAVNANLQESISGVRVAQAFVRQNENTRSFRQVTGEYLDARRESGRLASTYFPFVELLSTCAMVLVLGAGASLVRSDTLTAGALVAFVLYINSVFAPVQQLSQIFDTYQQARAALTKIREVFAAPVATPEAERPVDPGPVAGEVRFDDVSFRYAPELADALSGVDFSVAPGESVALVGATGAGKSTIVKLVARFYDPTEGLILVDGRPLPGLDLERYRRQLGYVPQEPFLFSGTIRDNIVYGRPDAGDAEVEEAARAVGAHAFIARLPFGYHHPVTERGRSLSAGQRQLIALARALVVNPAILLLDEATANLDLYTEARVARAMGIVSQGRTTILIAHRLPTARLADRILVIDGGRLVEEGTHDDLVSRRGVYAGLWSAFAPSVPIAGASEP